MLKQLSIIISIQLFLPILSQSLDQEKIDLIEQALKIQLMNTDQQEIDEARAIRNDAISQYVNEGDYGKSLAIIVDGIQKFPKTFILQDLLASLLGDYANHFAEHIQARMIQRSKEIFSKLFEESTGQISLTYESFMNEYYYRYGQYKNQYELGLRIVNDHTNKATWLTNGIRGYYSQGVGATNYAKELLLSGNKELAIQYAEKALVAWAQYFSYRNNYYNAYVHFAMSLTILGYKNEAFKALDHARDIIKKDHTEFQEIRDFIKQVEVNNLVCFNN